MKKNTSKIASMVLAVTVLFSMFSIPTAFAAAEGFDGYTGELGTIIEKNSTISGVSNWMITEEPKNLTASIISDPKDASNKVINLKGQPNVERANPAYGLSNATDSFGENNNYTKMAFKLARGNSSSKQIKLFIRNNSSRQIIMSFDLMNGQVLFYTTTGGYTSVPAYPVGSTLYIQDLQTNPLQVGEWIDIEIYLLAGTPRKLMIHANGKPLVYGADRNDGTVSVSAGDHMLPHPTDTTYWPNNSVKQMTFSIDTTADAEDAATESSFLIDDIEGMKLTEDEWACYMTLISSISPSMSDYSASLASPTIINTDMELPTNSGYSATVTWSSETEGVTVKNNKVFLPNAEDVTEAVLKATATRGGAKFEQSWTVKLAPRIKASVTGTTVTDGALKSVTINKRFELPECAKVILGVHNNTTNKFSIFKMLTPSVAIGEQIIPVDTAVTVADGDVVKAFVWNMDTLEPLAK